MIHTRIDKVTTYHYVLRESSLESPLFPLRVRQNGSNSIGQLPSGRLLPVQRVPQPQIVWVLVRELLDVLEVARSNSATWRADLHAYLDEAGILP